MKKSSLIVPSILIAGSLMLSAEASTVNEHLTDLVPQLPSSSTTSKQQVFDRKACFRAIARKHEDLISFDISEKNSEEKKSIIMLNLGKLYYDLAKNSEDLDEKGAYYEEAKLYLEESKLSEAKKYLAEIIQFN